MVKLFLVMIVSLAMLVTASAAPDPKAAAHYKQGKAFLDAKRYDQAVAEFQAAYAIDKVALHLFNIADAYDLKGDYDKAIEFFQKYVDADYKGPRVAEARTRIVTATEKRDDALAKRKVEEEAARQAAEKKRVEEENRRVQATGRVRQAEAYAQAGVWLDAGNEYRAAFTIDSDPSHLIAAGDAYRKAPDLEKAREAYAAYLDKVPVGTDSDAVRAKLADTTAAIEKAPETPAKPAQLPKSDPIAVEASPINRDAGAAPRSPRQIAGISLTAIGGAVVVGSLVVGLQAKSKWSDSEGFCMGDRCEPSGLALIDQAKRRADLATGMFIGGAAIALTGLVIYKTAPSRSTTTAARLVPNLGMPGVAIVGSF